MRLSERIECPPDFQRHVTDLFGVNRFGDPIFRFVWGMTETENRLTIRGTYEPQLIGHNQPCWILQMWQPPELFGTPDFFYFANRDPASGLPLMEYPEFGRYGDLATFLFRNYDAKTHELRIETIQLDFAIIDRAMPLMIQALEMTESQKELAREQQEAWENAQLVQQIAERLHDDLPTFYGPVSYANQGNRTALIEPEEGRNRAEVEANRPEEEAAHARLLPGAELKPGGKQMGVPMTKPGLYSGTMDSEIARKLSFAVTQRENKDYVFTGNMNVARTPQYYVRIFNVGDMEHKIERPWVAFNPAARAKLILIPACQKDQPYSRPFTIADIVQQPKRHVTTGEMDSYGVDGKFLAQDALNPEDPYGNWQTVRPMDASRATNEGTNLYRWGCFWTLNETPTAAELQAATAQRDAYYNYLVEEAKILWMGGTDGRKQIGNTHRRAASFFGMEFEWNQIYKATKECPECGTRVPVNASICSSCPMTFDWTQALARGVRTKQQAIDAGIFEGQPEEFAAEAPKGAERPKRSKKKAE